MNDALLQLIDAHIAERRNDKEFLERLRERHAREAELYQCLAATRPSPPPGYSSLTVR